MEVDSLYSSPTSRPTAPLISPAQRITELNEIDQSISTLLSAASDAIGVLSNSPPSGVARNPLHDSTTARSTFTEAASTYFSTLSSIQVRLRRQVYALEEAHLVKPGDEADARRGRKFAGDTGVSRVGGGSLDPSWLNARVSDDVAEGMKLEMLSRTVDFIKRSERNAESQSESTTSRLSPRATKDPNIH
ncbi:hypothetical protein LTR84_011397 [Exophiala bonariae]|uniref:Mediator of RNA polymerase II transcription subunit 11 n=1 Tax=Exophiala bonariae TaxID=1690606 RepID=A0AAV9MSE1_9EURO|nr:hypothetical protein LTR84_011397 [Exophiala bonariae]